MEGGHVPDALVPPPPEAAISDWPGSSGVHRWVTDWSSNTSEVGTGTGMTPRILGLVLAAAALAAAVVGTPADATVTTVPPPAGALHKIKHVLSLIHI